MASGPLSPRQLDAEDDDADEQADEEQDQGPDAEDVGLRGDVDADDLVLRLDAPVVGDGVGPDLGLVVADGNPGRGQEPDADNASN